MRRACAASAASARAASRSPISAPEPRRGCACAPRAARCAAAAPRRRACRAGSAAGSAGSCSPQLRILLAHVVAEAAQQLGRLRDGAAHLARPPGRARSAWSTTAMRSRAGAVLGGLDERHHRVGRGVSRRPRPAPLDRRRGTGPCRAPCATRSRPTDSPYQCCGVGHQRHAAALWLEAEDAAVRRRDPDRAAAVGGVRDADHAGRHGGGRAAARAARRAVEVPRVAGRARRSSTR